MTAAPATTVSKRPTTDYATLLAQVRSAGLLERSGRSSLPRIVALGALVIAGVFGFVWLGSSWWQLGVAAYFAVVFAQLGFLGHDAGHQQLFATKKWNDRLGIVVSNLGIGLSYGWWVDKHNRHHRNPNDLQRDPDVRRNVLAWSQEQAARQRGPLRFVAAHQGAFFFPLLLFEAWNLHVGSARTLLARPRERRVEIVLLAAHAARLPHAAASRRLACFGRSRSSRCNSPSLGSTWDAASPPITKACRTPTTQQRPISCGARY